MITASMKFTSGPGNIQQHAAMGLDFIDAADGYGFAIAPVRDDHEQR